MKTAIAITLSFFLIHLPGALACVGCRETGLNANEEPQTITAGIALSWGVLTMLFMVFFVVGTMTYYIVNTCRRLDNERRMP
jgi:hypothetical protein